MQYQQPAPIQQTNFVAALQEAKADYVASVERSGLGLVYKEEAVYAHTQIMRTADKDKHSLMLATHESIMESLIMAANLRLSLNPRKNHAYLIPRWNGQLQALECHLDIGYRGYQYLAASAGAIKRADACLIHENDHFEYHGPRKDVVHTITNLSTAPEARGAMAGAYCVAELADGSLCTTVMSPEELQAVKAAALRLNGKGFTPWNGPFESQMYRKTMIRRSWKDWEMLVESVGGDKTFMQEVSNYAQPEIDVTPVKPQLNDGSVLPPVHEMAQSDHQAMSQHY